MKLPNRYASQAEQLLACNKMPYPLKQRLKQQQNLKALIAPFLSLPADSYQLSYQHGVLTFLTEHTSSLGHLRYLQNSLLLALQKLPEFSALHTIKVVAHSK